jgi:hypothetical protein
MARKAPEQSFAAAAAPPATPPAPTLMDKLRAKEAEFNAARQRAVEAAKVEEAAKRELATLQAEQKRQRNMAFAKMLEKDDDLIDVLAPEHSRTSCSDTEFDNYSRGCTRCALLHLHTLSDYDDFEFEFTAKVPRDY